MLVDEDAVFEAYGFKAAEEEAAAAAAEEVPIPSIPPEIQQEMEETTIPVDDKVSSEPLTDWDRDNLDMDVGAIYPSMPEFRLAVRHMQLLGSLSCTLRNQTRKGSGVAAMPRDVLGGLELKHSLMIVSEYIFFVCIL